MPLTPDRLRVGNSSGCAMPDLSRFNSAAAASSQSFFVSHRKSDDLSQLVRVIGTRSDETIQSAIGAAFEEFKTDRELILPSETTLPVDAIAEQIPEALKDDEKSTQKLDYPVSFDGIADRETAERIAAVLNHLVYELRAYMALDRLDGFTFAEDYDGALEKLDRGFISATPLKASKPEYGESVAMTPKVMRVGIIKSHVVARLWIALSLISEDENARRLALHLVVQQLAHVACTQLFDEALPGARLSDPYDAFLYPYIAEAWSGTLERGPALYSILLSERLIKSWRCRHCPRRAGIYLKPAWSIGIMATWIACWVPFFRSLKRSCKRQHRCLVITMDFRMGRILMSRLLRTLKKQGSRCGPNCFGPI